MLVVFGGLQQSRAWAETDVVWNFGDSSALATPSSLLPPDIAGSPVTQGENFGTTPLLTTTSVSGSYREASGQYNAAVSARIGLLNTKAGGSTYFEFRLTPAAGKPLVVSALQFGTRRTGTGPQAYALFSSLDGFAAPLATGTLNKSGTWTRQAPAFSAIAGPRGAAIVFRIYGFGGTGSPSSGTANWRIDDLVVTASTLPETGGESAAAAARASRAPRSTPSAKAIHEIQGDGATSPLVGKKVTVQGVVTASFQSETAGLGGFFLQASEVDYDTDPATSEGLYVFDQGSSHRLSVSPGDVVLVSGTVSEFGTAPSTLTELSNITSVTKTGTASLPKAILLTLPMRSPDEWERFEGMQVHFLQTLTVTDNYALGRYGEFVVSSGRLRQPTNFVQPGAAAEAQAAVNQLNRLVIDDHVAHPYPDPTPFLEGRASFGGTLRGGDTVNDLTGVLSSNFGNYILEPTIDPAVVSTNPRTSQAPALRGRLRVAISNVLNFFNGNGGADGFPTTRGASTPAEYLRQRAKIVRGLLALNADMIGLTEVENDGFGPASAIRDLVEALNIAAGPGERSQYTWLDASGVDNGSDQIHVAIIYRPKVVVPVGKPASLTNLYFKGVARPPLAQTFRELATNEVLTVCVNHFRAKGSAASSPAGDGLSPNPNLDQNDGQGTNNYVRTREAQTLAAWLATDPTESGDADFLILGDLNAYAKEDPLIALERAGFVNLTEKFEGEGGYSYAFHGQIGHLDHALVTRTLESQVVAATTWHANADEPSYLDYNLENKSLAQQEVNIDTPYRYSDHDPVLIDLTLHRPSSR